MKSKAPRRTCLGCGNTDEQAKLLRMIIGENGELELNAAKGRGGYLHPAESCWGLFLRRKSVYRAFHAEVDKAAKERLIAGLRARR